MRYDREQEQVEPKGFDLKVTHRDDKTGLITSKTPYILRVCGEAGSNEKSRLWERPAGSGNLWDKHNNPIGRWVYEEKIVKGKKCKIGKYDPDATHVAFTPPETTDQKLARSLTEKEARISDLERELASIKVEKEKKSPTQVEAKAKKD